MKQYQIFQNLLNLSNNENDVFLFLLKKRRARVNEIVKFVNHPRSTVVDTLSSLKKRRLVRLVKVASHNEWKITNQSKLVEKFFNVTEFLQTDLSSDQLAKKSLQLKLSKKTEFVVYIGVQNILSSYLREFGSRKNERVRGLQTTSSASLSIAKATRDKFIDINNAIKKNKLIMEMVMSENMIELFKTSNKEWLKSIEGRIASTIVVPDSLLNFNAELVIFNDKILITNWEDELMIVIKNKDVIVMIKLLFSLLCSRGRKIDYNQEIAKLI